jgi:hypothetical protein
LKDLIRVAQRAVNLQDKEKREKEQNRNVSKFWQNKNEERIGKQRYDVVEHARRLKVKLE